MDSADAPRALAPAYARFLPRLRALIVDSIILAVVIFGAVMIAVAIRSDNFARPLGFAVAAFWLLYEPLFVSFAGGTLGHIWANLRVVDDRTGGNVGFLKAVARAGIKGALGWVSFVTMLTTRRSQAVHDLLTRSTVQIRDPSKAGPKLYIGERTELESSALPSRTRRALAIVACVAAITATYFAIALTLMAQGLVTEACYTQDRCTRADDLIFNTGSVLWIGGCIVALVLGWRGKLWGARRRSI
jgi:uncharacterized RDD family membrane protein YckC